MEVKTWLVENRDSYADEKELLAACVAATGRKQETVRKAKRALDKLGDQVIDKPPTHETSCNVDLNEVSGHGVVTTKSLNIKTEEEALAYSNVDTSVWEVERKKVNFWDVTIGAGNSGTKKTETYTNYQITLFLRRKVTRTTQVVLENIIKKITPAKKVKLTLQPQSDPNLLLISLYDFHFGKLAWAAETGGDFDLTIAENLYQRAVIDMLSKTSSFNVESILFPIGNDFFHINDPSNSTPKAHNQLDTDGRLAKVFECGLMSCIKAINMCTQVAPTEILWVPGNHDPEMSYYLCKVLQAYFRDSSHVKIDVQPKSRKYKRYGTTLLGFTHGDEEPHRDLPRIMADENSDEWAGTYFHEWMLGHLHKAKKMSFISTDTYGSTAVRIIPSLTSVDYWHYKKGYVNTLRAAESYLWSKEHGFTGQFSTNIKDVEKMG